jgi:hypothetical protein
VTGVLTTKAVAVLMAMLLAACAGSSDEPTATGPTAPGDATTEPASPSGGEGPEAELPPECVEAITGFLIAIEPVVAGIDFDRATTDEINAVLTDLETASAAFDPDLCPDVRVNEARAAWLGIAQREAPGTIGYIEFIYPDV